ncbi:hypothetical protein LP414_27510 [Polaromonas sp. P1(28)-13]|nr:hypothetical protein LP414_27510 [Polaromonas sp. P1(28)-13]
MWLEAGELMTRQKYTTTARSREIGSHDNLPHYAAIGSPADFYVWTNHGERSGKSSTWIKGKAGIFRQLASLHRGRQEVEFCKLIDELMLANMR